jgi:NADH dehydrogenase
MQTQKEVLIIGGGFGGVKLAQKLGKKAHLHVRLMDPKSFMEYHAAVYRLTTGRSAMEVWFPYTDLLKGTHVEGVRDTAISIDIQKKIVTGVTGSTYTYDTLVLALGCEASFFGIEGVEQNAFSINSVNQALKLRGHIHDCFTRVSSAKQEDKTPLLHIVVVGGGASGVELAGEFASYTRHVAVLHKVDPSLITIDLIEAMPRVLSTLPQRLSDATLQRLRELGVNVYLNRSVVKETVESLFLKDMQMTTKTVVWTAGLKGNSLLQSVVGLTLDKRGRVIVDDSLHAVGTNDVYAIGDIASTKYSGMAQTALADAAYVAKSITAKGHVRPYVQPAPAYAVPVGPNFAVVLYHGMKFSGRIGWILRRAADARAFFAMLQPVDAFKAFVSGFSSQESCEVCYKKSPGV